ncbi:MAG: MFS transporter [Gammaproteobacteria bacterium]|nr:MFS transporter [Gammaproteobacteria bacterium]
MRARTAGAAQGYTLVAIATLPTLAIAALVSILPVLFQRFEHQPGREWLVPMILTMPSLCVALFSSPIGAIADFWGRRRLLLLALAAFALFGLAPFLFDGLFAILASRAVVGLAEAAILTCLNTLIGDYFEARERQRWLALQSIVGPIVAWFYVLAGGYLGEWSWRGPFLLYLCGLVALIPAVWTLHEPLKRAELTAAQAGTRFPWGAAALVSAVTLVVSMVFFVQNVQHGRIFGDLGAGTPRHISWAITVAGTGTLIGGLAYRQIRGKSIGWLLAAVFICYGIGYVGVAHSPNYRIGIPFDALAQFAGGLAIPVLISWTLTKYDLAHRGRGMGLWAACFFLGQFLSPPALTLIGGGRWSFLESVGVVGIACLGAAAAAAFLGRRSPPL